MSRSRYCWRQAIGGFMTDTDRVAGHFLAHAADEATHHVACDQHIYSVADEVGEGAELCPACMAIVWGTNANDATKRERSAGESARGSA